MNVFNNYDNYKKHEGNYAQWKKQNDIQYAKKLEYLKNNPLSPKEQNEYNQKGKVLINAIDVMDEYSQTKAEDAEIATDAVVGQIMGYAMMLGMLGGAAIVALTKGRNKTKEISEISEISEKSPKIALTKMILPYSVGIIASVLASVPLMSWAAQAQMGASRIGRFEALNKDLSNPNKFAILDSSQEEQVQSLAKDIPVDAEMKKSLKNSDMDMNPFGFLLTIKDLLFKNKAYQIQQAAFDAKLQKDKEKFNLPLSQKDILSAKKDQQLLTFLVEKIDIASQDYAENVELATNTLSVASVIGGGLVGWVSDKILKHVPMKNPQITKMIPWGIGLLATIGVSSYAATIQKQASRIGRFKAKQELEQNPNNFVYVDEEKLKSMPDIQVEEVQKPNFFKFLWQVMKDNKEYKKYLKTEAIEDKKHQKALDKITFNDEQISRAKALQQNTFKTFNKVDENSQKYSESIEAVGQIVQSPISIIGSLLGMGIGSLIAVKQMKAKALKGNNQDTGLIPVILGSMLGTLPAIGFDIYITKEQKKASSIAAMLAIQEMSDYKNFVDYDNLA